MKILNNIIENVSKVFNKKEIECELEGHCPIYLSYLGKFDEKLEDVKHCKNANKYYCKKYILVDIGK